MNGSNRDGWVKEGSQRNNDIYIYICTHHHTSPSYTSQSSRNVDDDLETPLFRWMRPLEKFDSRGSRREIIPPYFSTLPFSIPEGAATYEVRIKLCVSSATRFWKFSPDGICWREYPVYPMCHGNAVNGSCHRQALDRTCGCGINGD